MEIKIVREKWLDNKPLVAEFKGTIEEFQILTAEGFIK